MKRLILAFVLIISIIFSYAQKTVAVLSGTTWSFYDDFSPALRAAPAGATIYVPGGTFDLGTNGDTINKPITIIGVGYHIDSTGATGRSILTGNFSFANGGDNVSIIGVYLNGNVQILNSNNSVSNTYLFRSRINDIEVRSGNTNYMFNSIMINECVVNNIGAINSNMVTQNIVISNSFCSSIRYLWDADIKNNIISGGYYYSGLLRSYALYSLYNCRVENNIIYNVSTASDSLITISGGSGCMFKNNMTRSRNFSELGSTSTNSFVNTIYNLSLSNDFVNVSNPNFSSLFDYHLKSTSSGKNAGTDGTDIGIYGGAYPYKEGAVPPNPHISTKSIAPTSAANGTLPVNIKVLAQDR